MSDVGNLLKIIAAKDAEIAVLRYEAGAQAELFYAVEQTQLAAQADARRLREAVDFCESQRIAARAIAESNLNQTIYQYMLGRAGAFEQVLALLRPTEDR